MKLKLSILKFGKQLSFCTAVKMPTHAQADSSMVLALVAMSAVSC
jgi:hypothetical protein